MSQDPQSTTRSALRRLLRSAEEALGTGPNASDTHAIQHIRSVLDRVEARTPGGAPLHAQLDTVRKWLAVLERPDDHERFGGAAHLRDYLLTQLRLAGGALEDFLREMT